MQFINELKTYKLLKRHRTEVPMNLYFVPEPGEQAKIVFKSTLHRKQSNRRVAIKNGLLFYIDMRLNIRMHICDIRRK